MFRKSLLYLQQQGSVSAPSKLPASQQEVVPHHSLVKEPYNIAQLAMLREVAPGKVHGIPYNVSSLVLVLNCPGPG